MHFLIRNKIKNLGVGNNSRNDETLVEGITDALKAGLNPRENSTRRDYKLTSKTTFEYFMDYFSSELLAIDLLYIVDSTIKHNDKIDELTLEKHKFKVRDILINRIDQHYYSRLINIKDPVEMLDKIKELKRCESRK